MSRPLNFPSVKIVGERDQLLAPYRYAVTHLSESIVYPGDESALKAPALRGAEQAAVDAWDAALGALGLRWAEQPVGLTDSFLAAFDNSGFVPARLQLATGAAWPADANARMAAPLLALAEWELYRTRGNRERLEHAYGLLRTDFLYREEHQRRRTGLCGGSAEPYRLGATGRFMLGGRVVPSLANGASWVDACGMYALNTRLLAEMARVLGRREEAGELEWAMRDIAEKMNARMWSADDGWYYDLDEHGSFLPMRTLASIWAIFAGVAPRAHIERMVKHLGDPTQFERAHGFSTVSAGESDYRRRDGTPVGVARADFNLIAIEALYSAHQYRLAQRVAESHLKRVARVLADSGELYLAYDPDRDQPAPLPDGSSGSNSPLALACCVQNTLGGLLGIRMHGQRNELELNLPISERHLVEGLNFNHGMVNIDVAPAESSTRRTVEVMCDMPLRLRLRNGDQSHVHEVPPGMHTIQA